MIKKISIAMFIIYMFFNILTAHSKKLPPTINIHGEMILIPAGEFSMGSSQEEINILSKKFNISSKELSSEVPCHTVYLDAYYIDKYEVTNGQFKEFIDGGGYNNDRYWTEEGWNWKEKNAYSEPKWWLSGKYHSGPDYPDYPVTGISWYEASAYASWAGKRLPTEAEWEKAAGGTKGNTYPWGMEWDDKKAVSLGKDLQKAGMLPEGQSPYGLMDMAGNVWEWCSDWYSPSYYISAPKKNPQGIEKGTYKTLRGGCFGNASPVYYRCSMRNKTKIDYWDIYTGFRCVKDAKNI